MQNITGSHPNLKSIIDFKLICKLSTQLNFVERPGKTDVGVEEHFHA